MIDSVIHEAVLENKRNRDLLREQKVHQTFSKIRWMMEYCTIHINIGRAVGKTKYIIDNAKAEDFIVCTEGTKKLITHNSKVKLNFYVPHIKKDFSIEAVNNCKFVFVDEPQKTLKPFTDRIDFYNIFLNNFNEPTFIMLGE